jgi:hypothetical protein
MRSTRVGDQSQRRGSRTRTDRLPRMAVALEGVSARSHDKFIVRKPQSRTKSEGCVRERSRHVAAFPPAHVLWPTFQTSRGSGRPRRRQAWAHGSLDAVGSNIVGKAATVKARAFTVAFNFFTAASATAVGVQSPLIRSVFLIKRDRESVWSSQLFCACHVRFVTLVKIVGSGFVIR